VNIEQDIAQVCENGHVVNSFSAWAASQNHDFCPSCGAKTQMKCTQCATPIKGGLRHLGLTDPETGEQHTLFREDVKSISSFCPKCGQKFPWAGKKQSDNAPLYPTSTAPIFISHSPGVNVNFGSGNIHQEVMWVQNLQQQIDKANVPAEEKQKAKSILQQITENKLLNTVIGSVLGAATKYALETATHPK
jgi:predicted RNA-binding Zn-ribbon protein involved in translation (DUF1610 family)